MGRAWWRAALAGTAAAVALSGCGATQPSPIPTPMNRVVTVDRLATPDGVISYITERGSPAHDGSVEDAVEIRTRADLADLRGAPDDFKNFLIDRIGVLTAEAAASLAARGYSIKGCEVPAELEVWGIAGGVATGRERACELDSNDVIWAKRAGAWGPVARMQGGWDCAVLERYRVPADITASVCWYDGWKTRAYEPPRS